MIIERIYNAINDAAKAVYNAIAWLTVDNTIIVAADKYHRGMEFVKLELLWGLYLSNPVYDVFTTSPTFNNIAQIAPAQVWGIVLLLLATLVMYGYYSNRNASIGSSLEALIAGYNPEIRPTNIHRIIPEIIQNQGIISPTPSCMDIKFPIAIPKTIPNKPPIWQITIASTRN